MTADWGVLIATLIGPILAVWASDWRLERRQERSRREAVFNTLVGTRAHRIAPDHIAALNHIAVAFPSEKHPHIADKWRLYHRHLYDHEFLQRDMHAWMLRGNDLFADLVDAMAKNLKIPLAMETIKHSGYHPIGPLAEAHQNAELRALHLNALRAQQQTQAPRADPPRDPA
jgi:hypothetical protein